LLRRVPGTERAEMSAMLPTGRHTALTIFFKLFSSLRR